MVTRWVQMNIRIVQGFTNLLDKILISGGETAFRESNFLTTYVTLGFAVLF